MLAAGNGTESGAQGGVGFDAAGEAAEAWQGDDEPGQGGPVDGLCAPRKTEGVKKKDQLAGRRRHSGRLARVEPQPSGSAAPEREWARVKRTLGLCLVITRLLSGRVDVVDEVPLERVDALRAGKAIRVFAGPSLRVLFLTLRVTEPPFADPRVHEAVDLALVATKGPGLGVATSGGYSDAVLDGLLAASNETTEPTLRVVTLQKALARVAEERPVLPLLLQSEAIAVSRRIDWTPGRGLRLRVEDMRLAE